MNLSIAEELVRRFEGFRSKPYLCPAGVPTIGFGSTRYPDGRTVTMLDTPIRESAARAIMLHELETQYAPGVIRCCPGLLPMAMQENDWGRFCAVVDFAYNLGVGRLQTSTLRRKINDQDWPGAREQLALWVRGGGRVLPGLVARRKAEALLM